MLASTTVNTTSSKTNHAQCIRRINVEAAKGEKMSHSSGISPPPDYEEAQDYAIKFNVGGRIFETMASTLRNIPNTRLADLDIKSSKYWRAEKGEYFFDRHSEIFEAVLNFYRSGELHIPLGLCGPIVKRELDFWGIEDQDVEMCCLLTYSSYQSQKESLIKFDQERMLEDDKIENPKNCWQRIRPAAWTFLNNPRSSKGAMAFAALSTVMIIISILSLVLASHSTFRVSMSDEDWATYHKVSLEDFLLDRRRPPKGSKTAGSSGIQSQEGNVQAQETDQVTEAVALSDSTTSPTVTTASGSTTSLTQNHPPPSGRKRRKRAPQKNSTDTSTEATNSQGESNKPPGKGSGGGLADLVALLTEEEEEEEEQKYESPEDMSTPHQAFDYINMICVLAFTVEYLLRFIFAPRKLRFLIGPMNIIDLLSVLPYYVMEIIMLVDPSERYKESFLDIITALQVIRVFRVFRLMQHFTGLMILMYTMKVSMKEILLTFVFVCMGILLFGCLMYYVDNKETFKDVPLAFWWAIVTMTTVGYGDMYPTTQGGYVVGAMCAMSGVMVIALTVPIVVNNFMLFYQHAMSTPDFNKTGKLKSKYKISKITNDAYRRDGDDGAETMKVTLAGAMFIGDGDRCSSKTSSTRGRSAATTPSAWD